jgi:hypothetical protein
LAADLSSLIAEADGRIGQAERGLEILGEAMAIVDRNDERGQREIFSRLEAKSAQDGLVLTEAQMIALEKAKTEKEAHGEFKSEHPGYCGAQGTFYVGNLKGVGRVYQQTFIDTYVKVARLEPFLHGFQVMAQYRMIGSLTASYPLSAL